VTTERKADLDECWQECERQIQAIHAGKVVDGDPAEAEGKLLEEQDAIEYELGLEQFGEARQREDADTPSQGAD